MNGHRNDCARRFHGAAECTCGYADELAREMEQPQQPAPGAHTPGPWTVEGPSERHGYEIWAPLGETGSMMVARTGHAQFDKANAYIMAAALDLLAVVEHLADLHDAAITVGRSVSYGLSELRARARAARTKARGTT